MSFQPKAIFYDSSATDFIHVESTVSLAMEGIERLIAVAGITAKGRNVSDVTSS